MIRIPDALRGLLGAFPAAHIVSSCGYVSRDLLAAGDRRRNLYLVGSMGLAAPIAAGISRGAPDRMVIAVDGDGSFAMNLSGMLVAAQHGARLLHVVLDDGVHASTGGQAAMRPHDPVSLALGAGYAAAEAIDSLSTLSAKRRFPDRPALWHLRCSRRDYPIGPRLALEPPAIMARFSTTLTEGSSG